MAYLAHGYRRVRSIGHVQPERMDRVGEMIGFEPVTCDAGLLADRFCVGRLRVRGDVRIGEPGRGARQIRISRAPADDAGQA